jgi:hypothetical protein
MVPTLVTVYFAVFAGLVSVQPAAADLVSANSIHITGLES